MPSTSMLVLVPWMGSHGKKRSLTKAPKVQPLALLGSGSQATNEKQRVLEVPAFHMEIPPTLPGTIMEAEGMAIWMTFFLYV